MDFDKIFKSNQSVDELGSSLLGQARENSARRRRNRSPSGGDLLKAFGAQLAGHFAGDYLRGRFDNELQEHLNSAPEMNRRALVRASVNEASDILAFQREAVKHSAGERGAVYDDLVTRLEAQLRMQLGPDAVAKSDAGITRIAKEMADDNIDAHFKNYQARITAAKNVNTVSGGDPFAYYKEIRRASGADQTLLAQISRRVTSAFRDENDTDVDNALYNTVTSSRIYKASEEYRNLFDKSYAESGTALAAANVSKFLSDPKNKESIRAKALTGKFVDIDLDGDGIKEKMWMQEGPDGNPVGFVDVRNLEVRSPEGTTGTRRRRLNADRAEDYFYEAFSNLPQDYQSRFADTLNIGGEGVPEGQRKAQMRSIASTIYNAEQDIESVYGDLGLSKDRIQALAVRSVEIDMSTNDGRFNLIRGNTSQGAFSDNPLLTFQAMVEEYEDADSIPEDVRDFLFQERIPKYLGDDLATTASAARVDEVINYVENNSDVKDIVIGQMSILEALDIVKARVDLRDRHLAEKSRGYTGTLKEFIEKIGGLEREAERVRRERQTQEISSLMKYVP